MHGTGTYRKEIKLLIEDPLPKRSKESFFIQISDFISYFIYINMQKELGLKKSNRLKWLKSNDIDEIINLLKPSFNTEASKNHHHGFVVYPK